MDKFSQAFEADTGKILNIVINSLYSDRDIFLRELLSNASDAIQKRRFMGQTIPDLLNPNDDQIEIIVDKKKKTIEIIDTGIGLNKKELAETLGTIAQSGTANFLKENDNEEDQKSLEQTLIGQFGVGFYSAFMVSETVEVTSRKAGTKDTSIWESDGQSGYSISESSSEFPVGTSIKLYLKKDAKNYSDSAEIQTLIKKYSDHIQVPVKIKETNGESQQVNSAQALWTKQAQDISTDEYKDFYNSNFSTFDDPF